MQDADAADWLVEPPWPWAGLGTSAALLHTSSAPLLALGAPGWDAAGTDDGAVVTVEVW